MSESFQGKSRGPEQSQRKILSSGISLLIFLTDHESVNLKGKVCHLLQSSLNRRVGGTAFSENHGLYDLLSFEKSTSVKYILLINKCLLK